LEVALQNASELELVIDRALYDLFAFCPKPDDDVSVLLIRRTSAAHSAVGVTDVVAETREESGC